MGWGLVPEPRGYPLPHASFLCGGVVALSTRALSRALGFLLGILEPERAPDGEKGAPALLVSSYSLFPYCLLLQVAGTKGQVARRSRKKLGEGEDGGKDAVAG